jgi:hypothetical protein
MSDRDDTTADAESTSGARPDADTPSESDGRQPGTGEATDGAAGGSATGSAAAGDRDADLETLAARVDENAADLLALLDLLEAVRGLSGDLTPELRRAAAETREPIAELRTALEHEETLRLVRRVGANADALADLLDLATVARDLSAELTPELRAVAADNRRELERLRLAFEREETLVLVRRLGNNTGTFLDLLATLEVASDAIAAVAPSDDASAAAARGDIERLAAAFDRTQSVDALVSLGENMDTVVGLLAFLEGFGDAAARTPAEYRALGERVGRAVDAAERVTDPAVLETVEAGASALADGPDRRVGPLGLVAALRNDDVQRTLGAVVETAERVGRTRARPAERE